MSESLIPQACSTVLDIWYLCNGGAHLLSKAMSSSLEREKQSSKQPCDTVTGLLRF